MSQRDAWEERLILELGEHHWDEATELCSMIADECMPDYLNENVRRGIAADLTIKMATDVDYHRCIAELHREVEG